MFSRFAWTVGNGDQNESEDLLMTNLKTPYKDLLPPLTSDEFAALKADVAQHGVRDAIVVDEDGNILDGYHRYAIDRRAPQRVVDGLTDAEKQAFVFRSNSTRRNLSPDQKFFARAKLKRDWW